MKSATLSKNSIQMISIDRLKKNEWNCNTMTKGEFESLKTSMKIEGQLNPILVTPRGDYFLIIDGEKRLGAAIDLGWKSLQAIVEDGVSDDRVKVRCFTSHYNKGFLDPIKTFNLFYGEWMRESSDANDDGEDGEGGRGKEKVTTRQLEQKYGVDQSWISRILTIREIPEPVRNYISSLMRHASKRFSITHAIVLAEKAKTIPEEELKKVVDYFFSPQNKKVESYTDLRLLLETVVQELRSETSDSDDVAAAFNHQDFDDDDNDRNDAPNKTRKESAGNRNDGSSTMKSRPAVEGNFNCEGCDNRYMIDWNNRRVLKLTPEDTFVRASEVQTLPAKVTDGCPRCGKQVSIDFEGRTFRWS